MNKYIEIKLNLRYEGGDAEAHKLDLYDASRSIKGLSQVLHIVSTSLIKSGEVRQRYTPLKGVGFYFEAARKGSFLETISILVENEAVQTIGLSVFSAAFWDMIKYTLKNTVGKKHEPETKVVKDILKDNPNFAKDIANALETPLIELQRPIESDSAVEISIERPRIGRVIQFDVDTLDLLLKDPEPVYEEDITGNVTRFNALSLKGGRFYSNDEKRTISFTFSEDLDNIQRGILTKSLDRYNDGLPSEISLNAFVYRDKSGKVKRYKIEEVERKY